jgi:MerR family transcriptional regulator, heat shock protein HspR
MRKGKSKAAYMISAVAQQYEVHPQTLRLYEREGLLKPSRSDGNTRLYTDEDLERLEVILKLTREFGVNLAGVEIILNMREKMEAMQRQVEEFISTLNQELAAHIPKPPHPEHNSLIPVITLPPLQSVSSQARDAAKGNPTATTTRRKITVRAGSSRRDEAE